MGVKNALLPKFKKLSRKTLVMHKTNGVPFCPIGRTWMAFLVLNLFTEGVAWSCSVLKGVLENFAKFTGKHLC